jgi:hypothetical protein
LTTTTWMRSAALGFLAGALIAGGFAPIVPHFLAPYFAAASGICTGLAALFTHPPGGLAEIVPPPPPPPAA